MGRRLQGLDERLTRLAAFQAAKFLSRDDNDFVPPTHSDMLQPSDTDAPHKLAETPLGILQMPMFWQIAG